MKDFIPYIIILGLIYFLYESESKVEIKTETQYLQGKIDTLILRDTITNQVPIKEIEYVFRTDTVRDTVFNVVESIFRDTTEYYAIEVNAFSLLPVDSFDYKVDLFIKEKIVTRVDTFKLKETKTIKETNWFNVGLGVVGGYLIGVL